MSWVQYFYKWILEATPNPVRIVEILFLLLTIAGFAVKEMRPEWGARMDKLAWQLPLGLLIVTLIISLAVSSYNMYKEQQIKIAELEIQLETTRKQSYPPITVLLMEQYFKDKDIPLGEFGLVNSLLVNKTFVNCRLHGNIVIFLRKNNTLTNCTFRGDAESIFIITTNKMVGGVLATDNCTFIGCEFYNVSFIGNAEAMEKLRTGLK
jgi:hypothetical protein